MVAPWVRVQSRNVRRRGKMIVLLLTHLSVAVQCEQLCRNQCLAEIGLKVQCHEIVSTIYRG